MSEIRYYRETIEALLIKKGIKIYESLQGPADGGKIRSLEKIPKPTLPDDKMLRGLFDNKIACRVSPGECKYIKRYYPWNNKWVKFTECDGNGLIMDFCPAPKGRESRVFFRPGADNPKDKIIAGSHDDWMLGI